MATEVSVSNRTACEECTSSNACKAPADFYSLLTEDIVAELGEVDESWFNHVSNESGIHETQSSKYEGHNSTLGVFDNEEGTPVSNGRPRISRVSSFALGFSPINYVVERSPRQRCSSTPCPITLSLGASMGGHEFSWTSSMATPIANTIEDNISIETVESGTRYQRPRHLSKKLFNSQTQSKPSEELLKDNNSFVECEKLEDSSALCKLGRKMVNDREVAVAVCSVLEEPSSKDTDSGRQVEDSVDTQEKHDNPLFTSSPLMFEENGVAICQQGGNIVRPVCNDRSHFRPSPSDINKTPKMPPDATSIPRLNIFEKRLTNQRELCAAGNELSVVLSQGFSPSIMEHTLTEIESSGCDNESNSYVGGCKVPNSALKPVIESNSSGLYSPTESSKKIGKENCDSKKLCVNEKSHCLILNNGCKCNHYTEAKLTGIIPNCLIDSGLEAEFSSEMDMSQLINSHPNNENAFHSTNFTRNSSTEDVSYIKETIGNHNCHFPREEFKENDGDHTYAKLCTNTLMTTSKSGDIDDDVFESLQFNISQMLEREEMVYTRVKSVVSDCQNDILNPKLDKSSPKDQLVGKNVPTIVPLEVCNSDIPVVAINSPNSGIAQMKNSEDVAVVPNSAKNKLLQSCRKLCVNNKAHIKMSGSGGSIVTSEVNAAKNSAVEVFVLPSTTESSPECNECNQGNSNVIMGFATASGKEVSISKIALQKAKEFLWEEDISHSPMECISGVVNVPKDALQKVVMSPEAVKNEVGQWKPVTSVMLLKDGVAISSDQTKDLQVEICPKAKSFQGFSTASGKRVTVCAATLEKSKNIFRDESLSQINAAYLSKDTIKSEQANKEMMGSVSSFGECSSEENMCKTSIKENNDSVTGQNMKHVMKPPKRLLKNLSCDYPYQQKLDRKLDSNDMAAIKLMSSLRENFQGFSTASGKLVAVSDTALKKAQVLLCADDSPTAANLDEDSHFDSEVPNALPSDKHSGIGDKLSNNLDSCVVPTLSEITHANIEGFKTASGKKVVVSPMALERTKKLFTEDHSQNNPMRSDVNVTPVLAFSTASGKNVVVSPTALERARSLYLENGSHSVSSHPVENVDISGHCMQGLSSRVNGAKQRRSTNNESVRHENKAPICNSKCNSLSIDTSQFHIKVPDDCVMLKGFNTAGGKFIKINEESLESARQLFSRDDYSIDDSLDSHFRHGANKRHQKRSLDNLDTSREQVRTYGTKKVRLSDSALEVPEMSYNDLLSFDEQLDSMTKENQIVPSDSVFDQSLKEICTSFSSEVMCDPDARKNDLYNLPKEVSGIKSGNSNSNASKNSIVLMASLESLKSKMRNAKHADRRSTSSINHEISTEILETTEAFLADELIDDNESQSGSPWKTETINNENISSERGLIKRSLPPELLTVRSVARKEQSKRIQDRANSKIYPVYGTLWNQKSRSNKIHFSRVVDNGKPCRLPDKTCSLMGIKHSVLKIQSHNAQDYKFLWEEHYNDVNISESGITTLETGCQLIFDDENCAGKQEFHRALLDVPGIDSKLVDKRWFNNFYRWIIWKLAATEISFPTVFGGRLLTPDEVIRQLQYRYDCEINFGRRSALKKILERDDTAAKSMVLCIANIFYDTDVVERSVEHSSSALFSKITLEVTDGWYSVKAVIDDALERLVHSGKLRIGYKVIVHGCELIGSSEACSPLEAPANLFLKLSANCCRRVKWSTKLGYFRSPRPFPLPVSSLYPDGGLVGCIEVVVNRVYPIQYLEKCSDGTSLIYNEKTNNIAEMQFEKKRGILVERILQDVQNRFDREAFQNTKSFKSSSDGLSTSQNLFRVLVNSEGCAVIDASQVQKFTHSQEIAITRSRQAAMDKMQQWVENEMKKALNEDDNVARRNVVPFLKFRALGTTSRDLNLATPKCCLITLWRPSEDLLTLLKEGASLLIYYLFAENRGLKTRNEVHLKSTKMTKLEEKAVGEEVLRRAHCSRMLTHLSLIGSCGFNPPFGEVDIIGIIFKIGIQEQSKFDCVYVTDADLNIIIIKFWGGLKTLGVEDAIKCKTFITACNLQWRGKVTSNPVHYLHASELSSFTQVPKNREYRDAVEELKNSIKCLDGVVTQALEKVASLQNNNSPRVSTPNRFPFGTPKSTSTPLISKESSSVNYNHQVQFHQKMEYLQKFGTPPSIPTLETNRPRILRTVFKPPYKTPPK